MKTFDQIIRENESIGKDKKVVVSMPLNIFTKFESKIISEGRFTKMVGRIPVQKDSPHFDGGEYHGHVNLPGGKQISYTVSGKRLHPNKFPKKVPEYVKNAIAQVLKVDPNLLESYEVYDETEKSKVILIEFKQTEAEKLITILERAYSKE